MRKKGGSQESPYLLHDKSWVEMSSCLPVAINPPPPSLFSEGVVWVSLPESSQGKRASILWQCDCPSQSHPAPEKIAFGASLGALAGD